MPPEAPVTTTTLPLNAIVDYRSVRLVLALSGAGGRRSAFPAHSLLLQPRVWRCFSSSTGKPPSNPFEIDLNVLKSPVSTTEKLSLDDAKHAAALQQAEAQHDIDLLHDEMSRVFGEDVAEYGGDTSSSSVEETVASFNEGPEFQETSKAEVSTVSATVQKGQFLPSRPAGAVLKPKKMKKEISSEGVSSGNTRVDVLLLQGTFTFVRGTWMGGDVKQQELHEQIQTEAAELGIVVKDCEYFSEKIILQMLLEARKDQVVVLCWNISLSKSPFIVHALELAQARVIIVSPSNVEHGPLPSNVVGVLSGFWNQSMSLALNAAANLLSPGAQRATSKSSKNNRDVESVKKGKVPTATSKRRTPTCFLCGKQGHIRSKCPELPRNNV
ncbi:hypothetical protein P3T76_010907 [Phytophthora citrophthora]|uniref:3-dehydroquinate dehydratase n=1 Tax=Phytophthora citrophthora TaxID=4793 RepID=A0AAD9GAX1_9STRA|nr:hypothetical protein P3T76_010907 [Phytophthora citrophthora]